MTSDENESKMRVCFAGLMPLCFEVCFRTYTNFISDGRMHFVDLIHCLF